MGQLLQGARRRFAFNSLRSRLVLAGALFASGLPLGCGGSASETPPPLEPLPARRVEEQKATDEAAPPAAEGPAPTETSPAPPPSQPAAPQPSAPQPGAGAPDTSDAHGTWGR